MLVSRRRGSQRGEHGPIGIELLRLAKYSVVRVDEKSGSRAAALQIAFCRCPMARRCTPIIVSAPSAGSRGRCSGGAALYYTRTAMKFRKQIKECARLAAPYCVTKGEDFRLKHCDPSDTGGVKDKQHSQKIIDNRAGLLNNLQEKLYAQDRWAMLLIFQAMDAAGKDGVIKHVMS